MIEPKYSVRRIATKLDDYAETLLTCHLLPINRTSHISKKSVTMENDGHANQANTAKSRSLDF